MNDKKSKLGLWLRRGAAGLLSLMLVFSLIQPGLARADVVYICGKEEHTHSDACYEIKTQQKTVQVLKCSLAEAVSAASEEDAAPGYVHTHGESCYVGEELVCPLKEVEAHTHGAECYGKEPQCGQEEVAAHGHSDACQKELTCTQEHDHTEACYTAKECTLEETAGHTHSAECGYNLICEKPEIVLHEHDENCYAPMAADGEDKEPKLTCTTPEVIAHVHDENCYEEKTEDVEVKSLICGLEEHTHTDACVQKPEEKKPAWTCGKEAHTHAEGCYDAGKNLTCTLDEHTHTDACAAKVEEKKPAWTCGKEAHTHTEGCYDAEKTLTCTLEEHTHTDACCASDTVKCGICQGSHADADCTYCPLCKADRSQCVICDECGTHAGDHTSVCTKRLCETCQKNPCECPEVCEDCGVDPCECIIEEEAEPYVTPSGFINAAGLMPRQQPATYGLRRLMRTAAIPGDNSGTTRNDDVITKKTVSKDADGQYTLTIESYIKAGTNTKNIPVDIVLVLDESGSMRNCYACGTNQCTAHRLGRLYIGEGDKQGKFQNYNNGAYETKNQKDYYQTIGNSTKIKKGGTIYYTWNANEKNGKGYSYPVKWCNQCSGWYIVGEHPFKDTGCEKDKGALEEPVSKDTNKQYVTFYNYDPNGETGYVARWEVLNKAVDSFLDGVAEDARKRNVDNRVAVVSFSNDVKQETGFKSITTERDDLNNAVGALANSGGTHTDAAMSTAQTLIDSVTDGDRNKVVVVFTDGEPTVNSYFHHDTADRAIANAQPIKTGGATIYVIGIFGGANGNNPTSLPEYQIVDEDFLKDKGYKDDADSDDYYSDNLTARQNATNRFAKLLSSNFITANSMLGNNTANSGLTGSGEGYFLSPKNPAQLIAAFDKIASNLTISAELASLNASSVLKDVVTPYFTVQNAGDRQITAKSYSYVDENTFAATADTDAAGNEITYSVTLGDDGHTVTATGFDYYANPVGYVEKKVNGQTLNEYKGKKLVLTIPIVPNADFLGGNGVLTNVESTEDRLASGLYNTHGNLVEDFASPKLNIPVKVIQPECRTENIYLGEAAVVPHVANVGHFKYDADGDGTKETSTTTDSINNGYVNITYTITDETENKSSTFVLKEDVKHSDLTHSDTDWAGALDTAPLLKNDRTYKVTVKVEPTVTAAAAGTDDAGNAGVNGTNAYDEKDILVYKPHITFHDSVMEYGQTADYEGPNADNPVAENINKTTDIVWMHGNDTAKTEVMGLAPTLTFTYAPQAGAFHRETPVRVTKVVPSNTPNANDGIDSNYTHTVPEVPEDKEQDLVHEVFFYRDNCGFCNHQHTSVGTQNAATWTNFVVHLNSYDVTIEKKMAQGSDDIYQDAGYKVDVTITSDKLTAGMEIEYVNADGTSGEQAVTTAGTVTLKNIIVKAGKPATIKCVPYNAVYEIKETSGYGYKDSYGYVVESKAITEGVNVGPGATGTVTNEELSAEVFIKGSKVVRNPDGENHTFTFALEQVKDAEGTPLADTGKRHKDQSIDVKVSGQKADFSFGELTYETSDLAGGTVKNDSKVKTFYYMVTEATQDDWKTLDADETEFIVEVTLTGKQGALKAEITDILENDVSKGADYPIEFRNTLLGSLTVKKSVVGGGNPSDSFKFRLKLDKAHDGTYLAEQNDVDTTLTIKDGLAEFWLRRNEEITIYGLPHGLEVEVYEFDAEEYRAYHRIDTSLTRKGQTANAQVSTDGTTVKYINYDIDSEWLPQTGQLKWPILVLASLGIGLLGFGALTRKRKRNGK